MLREQTSDWQIFQLCFSSAKNGHLYSALTLTSHNAGKIEHCKMISIGAFSETMKQNPCPDAFVKLLGCDWGTEMAGGG